MQKFCEARQHVLAHDAETDDGDGKSRFSAKWLVTGDRFA
jgi:hypothetical protein